MLRGINRQDIFEDNEDYKQMTLLFIPTKIKTCKVWEDRAWFFTENNAQYGIYFVTLRFK